ncbi:uncharacterized protein LOC116029591 [Ipomoea triloba]|uniref:uncharacterized protein LOC116029591 n=1 Tax=Ipomoea triloba TaxID=35885 RepID=UPI00125E852B|nr:uncharacterized protein LOC116029591 [Ipomoea triloba]
MDDPLRYFIVTGNGLQELVEDCEVWNLVNQCGSPKVIEIWIIKRGVGDDSNGEGCGGSAKNYEESDGSDDSGEEYDGSEEELISDALEYRGLHDVEVQHQEKASLAAVACDEISYSDEGSIVGSDGETKGKKLPKFLKVIEVVGIDANESIFPIAYAIVEGENKNSWTWFLQLLKKDLEIDAILENDLTVMSDKQKGPIPAFDSVMPGVRPRFCVRHLLSNMRVVGFTSNPVKDSLWKAARACTMNSFKAALQELRNVDEGAFAWLANKHPSKWSRSHFTGTPHCDILVNNISESFNSMIMAARENPVINCLEFIRKKLAIKLFENKNKAKKWNGVICPTIVKKIDEIEKQTGGLIGYQCGPTLFEIIGTVSGQYSHGNGSVWHYVDPAYYISTYLKTYEGYIKPMAGFEEWPATNKEPPFLPVYNAKPGRPRKPRKRSGGETSKAGESSRQSVYLPRKHVTLHYTKCK